MGPVLSADWFWLRKRRCAAGGGCSEAFAAQRHSDPERMRGELLAARAWFQGACPWPLFRAFLAGQKGTSADQRRERNKNRKKRHVSKVSIPAVKANLRGRRAQRSRRKRLPGPPGKTSAAPGLVIPGPRLQEKKENERQRERGPLCFRTFIIRQGAALGNGQNQ